MIGEVPRWRGVDGAGDRCGQAAVGEKTAGRKQRGEGTPMAVVAGRWWRTAGLVAGVVLVVGAILAPHLGLGKGDQFILHRLIRLSRTGMAWLGSLVLVVSLLWGPILVFSRHLGAGLCAWGRWLRRRFVAALRGVRGGLGAALRWSWRGLRSLTQAVMVAYRDDLAASPSPLPSAGRIAVTFTAQALLLGVVTGVIYWLIRHDILAYLDGNLLLTLSENQGAFSSGGAALSLNPLQGLGDIWLLNLSLLPEFVTTRLGLTGDWIKVAVLCASSIEAFALAATISWWIRPSLTQSVAAGWLMVIVFYPIFYPTLAFFVFADVPFIINYFLLPLFIIPMWAAIGKGKWYLNIVLSALIIAAFWLNFLMIGMFTIYNFPYIAIFGSVFLMAGRRNPGELRAKLTAIAVIFLVLLTSGYFSLLYATAADTTFMFFGDDRTDHLLKEGSLLLDLSHPVGAWFVGIALAGAVFQLWSRGARVRLTAQALLVLVGALISGTVLWTQIPWSGPRPIYFEYVLWAIYPAFFIFLVGPGVSAVWRLLGLGSRRLAPVGWVVVPLAATFAFHGPVAWRYGLDAKRLDTFPPERSVLIDELQKGVALSVGGPFHGRVANLIGRFYPVEAEARTAFWYHNRGLVVTLNNDHRSLGLWYYNIPTLYEINNYIRPMLHFVIRRYLADKDEKQEHGGMTITVPNLRILKLLGVSYLLTDRPQPEAGSERVREMAVPPVPELYREGFALNGGILAVDRILHPYLGLSPTEITVAASGVEALEWLGDEGNDLEKRAVVTEPFPGTAALVPAQAITTTIVRDGIRVQAESPGRSLVVVPFQHSHCWETTSAPGTAAPQVVRANLLLTGLLFSGKLDTTLHFRLGPFHGGGCRLEDLRDSRRLIAPP